MHKILVIEDSSLVRLKIIKTLEKSGFTNNIGIDSADPLIDKPLIYLNNVKLIIMDIGLPGISGIEAAYWLKTNVDYARIPVIFLSGTSNTATVRNALKAGGVDYIVKPFEEADLIKRIKKIIVTPQKLPKETLPAIDEKDTMSIKDEKEIKKMIRLEYSRSVRGKQPVSFIRIKVTKNEIKHRIDELTETLREIDQIYVLKSEEILIILPLTDDSGSKIVVEKIENWLNKEKRVFEKISIFTITGDKSKTLEELTQDIFHE